MKDIIKARLNEMCTHILFFYNGYQCGIDPISRTHFDMWYGDKDFKAISIDEAMTVNLFGGKCLNEIADDIEITEGL